MKRFALFSAFLFIVQVAFSQILTKKVQSFHLDTTREIKIGLPKSYKTEQERIYPLIIALDGDYLFVFLCVLLA